MRWCLAFPNDLGMIMIDSDVFHLKFGPIMRNFGKHVSEGLDALLICLERIDALLIFHGYAWGTLSTTS